MVDTILTEYVEHDLDKDAKNGGHRGLELASYARERYGINTIEEAEHVLHRQRNVATNLNVSERENQLERNLAEALYFSIVRRGFSLNDYPDVIKDVLRDAGHKKIDIKGEDTPISRIKRKDIIDYAEGLLHKYNFPAKPARF